MRGGLLYLEIKVKMKFLSGLANCHLPGLYSFVLQERTSPNEGMKRVFYCSKSCRMDLFDGADFVLKPHNHRQDIKLTLLFGAAENVSVKFQAQGFGDYNLWGYKFSSALLNQIFSLERLNCCPASLVRKPITEVGTALHWSEVHTVTARHHTAWLVEEGELAPPGMERMWSVDRHLRLNSSDLYKPMDPFDLRDAEIMFRVEGL